MVTFVLESERNDDLESIEPALLSEDALSDWNRDEEDKAWAYLKELI